MDAAGLKSHFHAKCDAPVFFSALRNSFSTTAGRETRIFKMRCSSTMTSSPSPPDDAESAAKTTCLRFRKATNFKCSLSAYYILRAHRMLNNGQWAYRDNRNLETQQVSPVPSI